MILFVDDESRGIKNYVEELKLSGYEVTFKDDVDSAFGFLNENSDKIHLVILDVMMPPGKLLRDVDTDGGLRTGMRFHQKIRKIAPKLPIIIFTNFSSEELEYEINQYEQSKFLRKADYLPFELVEEIENSGTDLKEFIINSFQGFLSEELFLEALPGHLLPDQASQDRRSRSRRDGDRGRGTRCMATPPLRRRFTCLRSRRLRAPSGVTLRRSAGTTSA